MDKDAALLATMLPEDWTETLRRIELVKKFRALDNPSGSDVERAAQDMGLTTRSFYRLSRAYDILASRGELRTSMQGRHRSLEPDIESIIDEVREELGAEAPDRLLHLEVKRRCRARNLKEPSMNAILTRATAKHLDLRIRLRRRFDIIADASMLEFDVLDTREGKTKPAFLSAVLEAGTGRLLGHVVTAGHPTATEIVDLLPTRSPDEPAATLIATTDAIPALASCQDGIRKMGYRLDLAASLGIRAAAALGPVLGRRLGRFSLTPRRSKEAVAAPVPLTIARKVVAHLLRDERT